MADETLQKLKIVAETEVKVNEASAKKAGEEAGKALNDGMETVIRSIKSPFASLMPKATDFSKMRSEIHNKVNKQLLREQNSINQKTLQESIRSSMTHNEMQAMYNNLFGSPLYTFLGNLKENIGSAMSSIREAIGTDFIQRRIVGTAMTIGNTLKKVFSFATISPIKKMANAVSDVTHRLHGFFSAIKRIAVYRAIRWALKQITQGFNEGIQNAYQWAVVTGNQFARSMDMMATSSLYLKNSLGALATPIVNFLAPILDHLTDQFVNLINVVNRFIATITGATSWTKALKYPAEYMDSMAGSAKELKNQLLGFDDLNVLNANRGSGSASAMDYSKMFEQVELNLSEFSFTKSLQEAIKNSDWQAVGELLAQCLNTMIEGIKAKDISKWLGDKINSAITLVHTLLKEVNFRQIGVKIGEFISNLQLDWKQIADGWLRWVGAMGNILIGVVQGINWGNVAQAIMDYFNTMFYNLGQWFLSIDWKVEADKFVTSLLNFIKTIDWKTVATNLLGAVASMMLAVIDSFTGAVRALWRLIVGDTSALNDAVNLINRNVQSLSASANNEGRGGYNILGGGGRQNDPTLGYASGGFPEQGTMFYAGENGAEFVGQIGGRTGVYTADQMANSLASANEVIVNTLVSVGNAVVGAINRKDTSVNVTDIRRALQTSNMRYGV